MPSRDYPPEPIPRARDYDDSGSREETASCLYHSLQITDLVAGSFRCRFHAVAGNLYNVRLLPLPIDAAMNVPGRTRYGLNSLYLPNHPLVGLNGSEGSVVQEDVLIQGALSTVGA